MLDHKRILELCSGNEDAAELIEGLWRVCDVWDDIVDRDNRATPEEAHQVFEFLLFRLPANKLWAETPGIRQAFATAVAEWKVANEMERTKDEDQVAVAYTLRCSPYSSFTSIALAVGGMAAAVKAARYFRQELSSRDRIDSYMTEHLGD